MLYQITQDELEAARERSRVRHGGRPKARKPRRKKPAVKETERRCRTCGEVKPIREFRSSVCRACKLAYDKAYREATGHLACARTSAWRHRSAVPRWVDFDRIVVLYKDARTKTATTGIPHQVDHIVPFRAIDRLGRHVASGLHVPWNLQVLTARENMRKRSRLPQELARWHKPA